MGQRDIVQLFARIFQKYKISYLLTGSIAVSYFGYPRATHDIDFVIEIQKDKSSKLLTAFKKLGQTFIIDILEIQRVLMKSGQFNLYHSESGIKIDFWVVGDKEFEKNKFKRGKNIMINKQKVSVISPEDLILTKLLWCKDIPSERHLRDCIGVWKIQQKLLDKKYLDTWAEKLQIQPFLQQIAKMDY